jgi:hypothetical protein
MPRVLPQIVRNHLQKAKDSAILAVEMYNKPAIHFKSGGFIVLMVIAWTSLFHAIFFRDKIKPYYLSNSGKRYNKIDGDYKHWELDYCLKKYFKSDADNPIKKNLEFFIKLRNKVEHRSIPEIDSNIFGECQSMLLNFDEMLSKEFGESSCIREVLSFSLQLFPSTQNLNAAVLSNPSLKPVVDFVENFRSSISPSVYESGKFSFKAFLIQVSNHPSANALPIQFVQYDKLSDEEKENTKKAVAMIKYKYREVPVLNLGLFKIKDIVKLVQEGLGNPKVNRYGGQKDKFNSDTHTRCWKKYKARPLQNDANPESTDSKYCIYDEVHNDYLYTQDWIDFLIKKMKDDSEYNSLYTTTVKASSV